MPYLNCLMLSTWADMVESQMLSLFDKASSLILANVTIDIFDDLEAEVRHFASTFLDIEGKHSSGSYLILSVPSSRAHFQVLLFVNIC